MRVFGVLAFALVVGIGSGLIAQTATTFTPLSPGQPQAPGQPAPGQPTRTPARPLKPGETPPKGTAVIRGYVLAGGSGAPIRRAQVRAMAMNVGGGGVTSTDAQGRYEITDLPAGRYTITASKSGYVTGQFGQRRAGEPGTPIEILDSLVADKVNFTLARGAVIAGHILDDNGEPLAGVQVAAMRYGFMAGSRRLVGAGRKGATTAPTIKAGSGYTGCRRGITTSARRIAAE